MLARSTRTCVASGYVSLVEFDKIREAVDIETAARSATSRSVTIANNDFQIVSKAFIVMNYRQLFQITQAFALYSARQICLSMEMRHY
jgi:hypothetical protein